VFQHIVALLGRGKKSKGYPWIFLDNTPTTSEPLFANMCPCLLNSFSANPLALALCLVGDYCAWWSPGQPFYLVHQLV